MKKILGRHLPLCMLQFFEERCRQCRTSSGEELALLAQAVTAAVADGTRLSTKAAAFGSRVRLVHLGMCVLQAAHQSPDHSRSASVTRRGSSAPFATDSTGYSPITSRAVSVPVGTVPILSGNSGMANVATSGANVVQDAGDSDEGRLWDDSMTVSGSVLGDGESASRAACVQLSVFLNNGRRP